MTASGRYTLEHDGRLLEVEAAPSGRGTVARLFIDGVLAVEARSTFGRVTLDAANHHVVVQCWRPGRVATCVLRAAGDDDAATQTTADLEFAPPPGTAAADLARLKDQRPKLYATRHVVKAAGEVAFAALGIGAILRSLLPRIDWSWLPDISWSWLPDIDLPRIPDPIGWLVRRLGGLLPDASMPAWVLSVLRSARWWVPILIAVLIAANEVEKRRTRSTSDDGDGRPADTVPGGDDDGRSGAVADRSSEVHDRAGDR